MVKYHFRLDKIIQDTLLFDSVLYFAIAIQYIGFPATAGLLLYNYFFFCYLLMLVGFLSLLGAVFHKKLHMAVWNCILFLFNALLFFFLFIYLIGPFNVLITILNVVMLVLNLFSFFVNVGILIRSGVHRFKYGERKFFQSIDMKRDKPKAKVAFLTITLFSIGIIGYLSYFNFNQVITIKAPDDFKTISSYWGPPSLTLQNVEAEITPLDNATLVVWNGTLNVTPSNFINGTMAYVTWVYYNGSTAINYCNYSAGAESYPNGTVYLSTELPSLVNITIKFRYVLNNKVLQYLQLGNSTLIMNHHSLSHPEYPNGYWYYNNNFFESISRTYLFQVLDYWGVKYYLNVHNGIDFPHVFNYLETVPLCYTMLDWFEYQRSLGHTLLCQGISPDFEGGDYENLWLGTYNSSAVPLWPGSLLPDLISDADWYSYNSQNVTLFNEATEAWNEVYDYASNRGYSTYIVFQGGSMRDTIDGDIQDSRLPVFPTTDNPTVRFGIMSYQDAQDDVEGGRYKQYRDCHDQIAIYGDRGRSILTGWIAVGTSWYTDDELGLGRYIEDILVCQAAGMNEIFHAPIYRMQGKWGDDAILLVHQALNEWEKQEIKITVPYWVYKSNYMDAIGNLNHWWQFFPVIIFIGLKMFLIGTFTIFPPRKKEKSMPKVPPKKSKASSEKYTTF
ncbi:MAG: hypothetical protein ACFFCS_20710 [Candidatus Hodarchaeota archaeon]